MRSRSLLAAGTTARHLEADQLRRKVPRLTTLWRSRQRFSQPRAAATLWSYRRTIAATFSSKRPPVLAHINGVEYRSRLMIYGGQCYLGLRKDLLRQLDVGGR